MNNTLEAKVLDKYALSEKIKKGELLRLVKVLDTQSCSIEVIKGARKLPPEGPVKTARGNRYSKATLDMLRRYFVQRVADSREYGGVEEL